MDQDFIDALFQDEPEANLQLADPSLLQYYEDFTSNSQ